MTTAIPRRGRAGLPWLVVPLLLGSLGGVRAGEPPGAPAAGPDLRREPIVPSSVTQAPSLTAPASTSASQRIRLFRIQPGFLSDVRWLDQDELLPPDARAVEQDPEERMTINVGNDNPFFEFRRRTDPGGVGFTRVNTQVELFDTGRTACSLGLQAVTPAGLEFDGLPDRMGPTVVTPALSIFHALDDSIAVQAFVGKHVPVLNAGTSTVRRDLQYGLAVQSPVAPGSNDLLGNLYVSVGALGQHRIEKEARTPIVWEVLPGLHYKVADSWWISGGVSLPVGPSRAESGQQWQVTCSLQF